MYRANRATAFSGLGVGGLQKNDFGFVLAFLLFKKTTVFSSILALQN